MTLPPTADEMHALLTGALADALRPLGFARVAASPRGEAWDSLLRTHALGTHYLLPFVWERDEGGYFFDIWLEARDQRVEQVIQKFTPHAANHPTAKLKLSRFVGEDDLVVDSVTRLKRFVANAKTVISDLLPRTQDMAQLDKLINADREEVDFMTLLVSFAPLVIAYLGRNPRFDQLVMRADERMTPDPDDPVSTPIRMAVYLRTRLKLD